MVKAVLLLILLVGLFVFLYDQGYMVIKSTSALMFVGSAKGTSARFTSCNGSMKRVVRFESDGTYRYFLDAELSKGDIAVELLDPAKETVLHLDCASPSAAVTVEKRKKYYLVIRFRSATGRYALLREEIT